MKEIKFLQPVEAILNKNFNTSDEFLPLEPNCLKYTGKFEESDRGDYEIVVIKKGSRIMVSKSPNGKFNLLDASGKSCGELKSTDFTLLDQNSEFIQNLVSHKPGLWVR